MRIVIALFVLASSAFGAAPLQKSVDVVLGPKAFRDGDVIEITNVTATSPRLEQGDTVTVHGRFRLESRAAADISLLVTQTQGDGLEEVDAWQTESVQSGRGEFEVQATIKHRGLLHLTYYDRATGQPIGGVYFGTPEQMRQCADWDVSYFLPQSTPSE